MGTLAPLSAALLLAAAGQLAAAPATEPGIVLPEPGAGGAPEASPAEAAPAGPGVVPPPPLPAAPPTAPEVEPPPDAPDRIRTSDGKAIEGRIVGEVPGGLTLQRPDGLLTAIPYRVIERIERGGQVTMQVPEPPRIEVDLDRVREKLTLTFDVVALRRERDQATWGEKAVLVAAGAATAGVGLAGFRGSARQAIAALGIAEATAGLGALAVHWFQQRGRDAEIAEKLESLRRLDQAPVRAAERRESSPASE